MFVLAKKKDEKRWQVQIVESVRDGKSIRQKIVRNIGTAYSEKEVAEFKRIGEASIVEMKNAAKPVLSIFDPAEFHSPRKRQVPCDEDKVYPSDLKEEKRFNEGISDIFGKVYEDLGFDRLIQGTSKDREWNDILQSSVLARIAEPDSKRATSRFMDEEFDIKIPVQKIYRMMDLLSDIEGKIKQTVAQKTWAIFEEEVDVLFFDVTTLYFESIERDELRNFGFSKDCKFNQSQVMLALVTTHEGLPISYQLFPGNTFEGHTLLHMVKELKESFKVSKITLVADRGMFTRDNLAELEKHEIQYVVAAKLKSFSKAKKDEILNSEFKPTCVNNEFHWVRDFENDGRRLVVSYSSSRAKKDASDRQRLVDRLLKKVSPGKEDIKIGDVISNSGTKKYLKIKSGSAEIDFNKVENDANWDGLHGVITNISEDHSAKILERYRGLWQIEEAFRVNKHSLKMRPIYHWSPRRIRSHISLCYLTYAVAKHSVHRLKKKGLVLSIDEMRHRLRRVEASKIIDTPTQNRYVIPSATDKSQLEIYAAFDLERGTTPYKI